MGKTNVTVSSLREAFNKLYLNSFNTQIVPNLIYISVKLTFFSHLYRSDVNVTSM